MGFICDGCRIDARVSVMYTVPRTRPYLATYQFILGKCAEEDRRYTATVLAPRVGLKIASNFSKRPKGINGAY